ncbi:PucR-like helix-turn-helix protein [Herbihabitans rhizosphaerae]|uniref:PucR-like helix-turn-helix protein n=1 Tax=Herbihabitans rhizosphaerae TaxID=1872711 RepID=A0A4Q7L1U3_9PSEU|nr:helix-turn-helix domain-containing protein [Herbihabitans rhizosphaerae]RZS43489.1 PucR-like helix-turn-helix protein [Herbihabitans rhizosphaerae]
MTGSRKAGISAEAYQRLIANLPTLTGAVVRRLAGGLPFYRELPPEELAGDIVRATEMNIRLFARTVFEGRLPDDRELVELRTSAALRADEGVPLDIVIAAYHLGARVVWDEVLRERDDAEFLRTMHDLVMRYLEVVVPVVAAGYTEAQWTAPGEERFLLAALLGRGEAAALPAPAGAQLARSYVVLSLRVGRNSDEADAAVNTHIAARRKVRRLLAEAEMFAKSPVLSTVDDRGGLLLLPHDTAVERLGADDWRRLATLVEKMSSAAGAEVVAAAAVAVPNDVASAADLAREVLELVVVLEKPAGLYRLADVLLEYQLTRPGPARDELATVLAPLADRPDLLDTLRVYLGSAGNRRKAASELHVHPNTVDYRLARIAELTGLDPSDNAEAPRLAAAYAVRAVTKA